MNCRFSERPEVIGHRCVCRLCSAQCLAWCRELGGMSDANDVKWQGWMKCDAVHARTRVCINELECQVHRFSWIPFKHTYPTQQDFCIDKDPFLLKPVSIWTMVWHLWSIRLYHNALQCHFEAQGDRRNRQGEGEWCEVTRECKTAFQNTLQNDYRLEAGLECVRHHGTMSY